MLKQRSRTQEIKEKHSNKNKRSHQSTHSHPSLSVLGQINQKNQQTNPAQTKPKQNKTKKQKEMAYKQIKQGK